MHHGVRARASPVPFGACMENPRPEKVAVVDEVRERLESASAILVSKALTADETRALADLPSREVLLARIAGGLAAQMQQFAGLLQALPRNMAYGLKALIDQGGAAGAPAETAVEPPAEAPAEDA